MARAEGPLIDLTLGQMHRPPTVSVLLSTQTQSDALEGALRSILVQDYAVQCVVVQVDSTDGNNDIIQEYAPHLSTITAAEASDVVPALNHGFSECSGDIMVWLGPDDRLCPWACRTIASFVLAYPSVDWLTSSTPIVWSPSNISVTHRYVDGYSRSTFLKGRNLKGSSYFRHSIDHASTFWTRSLWDRAGACITAPLDKAGDFELWGRFWESADLACISVPLGGRRAQSHESSDKAERVYWEAAAAVLHNIGSTSKPSRFGVSFRKLIIRILPAFAPRLADKASLLWMDAETETCRKDWRYIV